METATVRYLIVAGAVLVAAVLVFAMGMDEGEVVTLISVGDKDIQYETGLWMVEIDGQFYLRADSPEAYWLQRIRLRPLVELSRDGQRSSYRATPSSDPTIQQAVNRAMSEKYGRVNRMLTLVRDHTESVAILLEPSEAVAHDSAGDSP